MLHSKTTKPYTRCGIAAFEAGPVFIQFFIKKCSFHISFTLLKPYAALADRCLFGVGADQRPDAVAAQIGVRSLAGGFSLSPVRARVVYSAGQHRAAQFGDQPAGEVAVVAVVAAICRSG